MHSIIAVRPEIQKRFVKNLWWTSKIWFPL